MKHFSLAEWTDFVRGVVTAETRVSMQQHLDENCAQCEKIVDTWASLTEFGKREGAYEPPPAALRIAESYFAPFKMASAHGKAFQLAQLAFDSFDRRSLKGVRGFDTTAPRRLMYRWGDVFIDMHVEAKDASHSIFLAGQVVDSRQSEGVLAGIPVSLVCKEDILFETTTNHLGEFHFSFRTGEPLKLLFQMTGSTLLVLLPHAEHERAWPLGKV